MNDIAREQLGIVMRLEKLIGSKDSVSREAIDSLDSYKTGSSHGIVRYAAARALGQKADSGFGYYPVRLFVMIHPDKVVDLLAVGAMAGAGGFLIYKSFVE